MRSLAEPVKLVLVRGAQALAWFDVGRIAEANAAARAADAAARRLGFEQPPFTIDYLRVLAGGALVPRGPDNKEAVDRAGPCANEPGAARRQLAHRLRPRPVCGGPRGIH